ncbi:PutA protein [Actinobacillus equuli]|nr:PutA protein [Actinobacillus equuli]
MRSIRVKSDRDSGSCQSGYPRHYQRLKAFLNDGRVLVGGEYNDETSKLAFTLIDEVNWQSSVMQEEIFGSIFPMLTFKTMNEAIAQVKANANRWRCIYSHKTKQRKNKY